MSTNKRPVAVKAAKKSINKRKGILYYTLGTQQIDAEGNFFIDDTIVKEGFDPKIVETLANKGTIVILEGDVLSDFEAEGFSYIDANNASTNTVRKLKDAEAAKAEVERKNAELEAKLAAMEAKATKSTASKAKGGSNG